ncbi:MAG TPA: T9SS type A sorting domain-containing protein [Chitinophagaceae bacterium]|jgi:hypothetical protein|nr:T9SS type A sorting domain-containing protein [Chitinophagaceae bacterium]
MKQRSLLLILILSLALRSIAQFTAGNIVVCRIGDQVSTLSINAAPVFLDEYTPAGTLVQSIPLPTVANGSNRALTLSGVNPRYGGMITRSSDGQYLTVPGFNAPVGYVDPASVNATDIARVVGLINYNANINTTTALTDWSSAGGVVSAITTDGNSIWCTAQGTSNNTGGLRYTTTGATTSTQINNTRLSLTGVAIAQGQLFVSQGTLVYKVGTGLPTTSGQPLTSFGALPTTGSFRTQFALFDMDATIAGVDVIYIADEIRGVSKFSLVSGLWSANGNVGGDIDDYRGLTADINNNVVTIYTTRAGANNPLWGGGELVKITDASGYNGNFVATPTLLATAPLNTASFKGVAFAPVQAPLCPSPGSVVSNLAPTSATISWNAIAGAGAYQYALTTNATPPASGTATNAATYNAINLTQGQTYYFHVRTDCNNFNRSAWNTVSFIPACTPPLLSVNNTGYSTLVNWRPIAGSTEYEYALTTDPNPPVSGTAITDTAFTVGNLSSVTQYYVHVRSNCASGGYSPWATRSFKTKCLNPIISTVINGELRQYKWNKVKGASTYEYALTTYRNPPITGVIIQDTSVVIPELNAGNNYFLHVRTRCSGNEGVSDWTTVAFQTMGLDAFPNPVSDKLTVRLYGMTVTGGDMIMSDMMGRIVVKMKMINNIADIDMRSLSPGIYLLKYSDKSGSYTVKVQKK